jgi:large repetitive protein
MLQYSQGAGYAMRVNFWSWVSGEYAVMSSRPVSITAPARASFDWSHQFMTVYPDDQLLLLGKTTTATTWDTLVNLIGSSFNSPGAGTTVPGTFVDTTVYLPTSWIGSDAIFRFVANSGFGPDVFFDNFVVEAIPTCAVPIGLNAAGSTTCASTTVTWTSSSSAVSTNLEYGPAGFTPGSGTSLTGLTGGTTNLTGLTPNTAYDVYVQDVCAIGTSPWSSASAVTTANAPQPTVSTAYTVLSMNPVTIQFDATIANATAVTWSFSNGGSATGASTVQSFGANGPAFAVATVSNDCGTVSDTLNFTVGMGENALATLRVFPNPTTGLVRVEFPMQSSGTAMVRVLSITGAQLTATNAQFAAGTASVDLDLRGLASGLYLLEVQTEEATGVQRLVIER